MNGQLSEQPVAELMREISLKSLSGRLRLEHDRVKVVAYFDRGQFLYAASNLKTLRVREYLKKNGLVSEPDLAQFNDRVADTDVVKVLVAQRLLSPDAAEQVQTRQLVDVLRRVLLWTEGVWEFDSRSRLDEQLNVKIELDALLLEAARRLPPEFAASRFRNPAETISPVEASLPENLLPAEGYLLSRLDRAATVRELAAISGLSEEETLSLVYTLTIGGLVKREHWNGVFRGDQKPPPRREEPRREKPPKPAAPVEREASRDAKPEEVEAFLTRVNNAQTHYDVLGVAPEAATADLKTVYYQLARRYHPDRFRKADAALVTRIESAFARITQAYDTLRDDGLRASYNAKLKARRKVEELADAAPKAVAPASQPEAAAVNPEEPAMAVAERAENHFKEGFAQLELGQRKAALSLFASAARAVPNEPRYRAYYGQMLAASESTRRAAEAELSAAIKLDPQNSEYRVMLAELYRDLGLKLRAKGEAERAVAADPNNRKARELLRALK